MASSSDVIKIPFDKEESTGGGRLRVPDGDYLFECVNAEYGHAGTGNPQIRWTFKGVEGLVEGKQTRDRTMLMPKTLWTVRRILEAMGLEVPSKAIGLKVSTVRGKRLGITLTEDTYEDKDGKPVVHSVPADYMSEENWRALQGEEEDAEETFEEEEVEEEDEDDLEDEL